MGEYKFRPPGLVETLLFIILAIVAVLGFLLITKAYLLPVEAIQSASSGVSVLFLWIVSLMLIIVAIILESMREILKEILEKLEK